MHIYNAIIRKVGCAGAAQGFSLSRGGMEPMKPVFFVFFALFFYLAFAFSRFTLVNYLREENEKFSISCVGAPRVSFCICVARVNQA